MSALTNNNKWFDYETLFVVMLIVLYFVIRFYGEI